MKTNKRRLLAALTATTLALTPCFAAGTMTAFAADNLKITVTPATNDNAEHTYEAYQVFSGKLTTDTSGKKVLSDIDWGSGIDSTKTGALAEAIKTNIFPSVTTLPVSPTAAQIAEALKSATDVQARQFADLIGKGNYLSTVGGTDTTTGSGDKAEITGLDAGYYLVKDKDNSLNGVQESAYTQFILEVVGDATANAKASLPTLTKKITSKHQNTEGTANTASIGENVNYELNSAVPDMTGYNKYFFIVNDDLDPGLTFNNDVAIYINGSTTPLDTELYEVQTGTKSGEAGYADGHTFQIVFKNFYDNFKDKKDQSIKITYSAKLNENAKITNDGNPNTANLTYSNNPNHTYTGDVDDNPGTPDSPDEPGSSDPKGITPEQTVKTYTTAVKIKKVDESGNVLEGAAFTLTGGSEQQAYVITNSFTESASGEYWKLKDGTYTKTDPTETGVDSTKYDDTSKKYALTQTASVKGYGQTETNISATVGKDGVIVFQGLGTGEYTLTESTTPDGYNTISPITFTIETKNNSKTEPDMTSANWSISSNSDFDLVANMFETTIENKKGSTLPSTGGIGTKLFYLFGSAFVIGASTFIVTKKRVGTNK